MASLQDSSNGMSQGSELDFRPVSGTVINWGLNCCNFLRLLFFKTIFLTMLLLTLFFGLVAGQGGGMLSLLRLFSIRN